MRVLLTGAAGFVGSHLCDRLLADGAEVIGVDNLLTGRRANIAHLTRHPRFRLLERDATAPLGPAAGPLDWVLHFASPASPPKYLAMPTETLRINSEGTYQLLELAKDHRAKFLLASTSEVYGDPEVHPQFESYWGHVNPIGPRSVYDEAKRFAEAMTMSYARSETVSTRIIRIFNTYGPRMDPDDGRVVTNFIAQALAGRPLTVYGDGSQTRSLQYVDDLVEGIVRVMDSGWTMPVNLGNPEEYTMAELASLVIELTGSSSHIICHPLPQDDPRRRRPDIATARRVLGWKPLVSVREGLLRTIAHHRSVISRLSA
jgi:dTDP-glucose 4,6-dehydratase